MTARVVTLAILCCTVLHLAEGVCKTGALTSEEEAVLAAHNAQRALHDNTEPLCYGESGDDVTFIAQSWTDQIAAEKTMKHSSGGGYGENIAMAGTTRAVMAKSPAYVKSTDMWYSEIQFWDFTTNAKSISAENEATGHFTQVVWRNTKQVRCGYATYQTEGSGYTFNNFYVTCQYYPPGNYNNLYADNVGPLKSAVKKTCDKPVVDNAILEPDTATIVEGSKVSIRCEAGYEFLGVSDLLTCNPDGNLTPAGDYHCREEQKKTCDKPVVDNATLEPSTATIEDGAAYTVKCTNGDAEKYLFCGSDGNLTPAGPITCEADQKKTCDKPAISNAIVEPDTGSIEDGATYTVKCLSFGVEKFLTCGSDGNLTPSSVTCEEMSGAGKLALSTLLIAAVAALLY